MRLIPFVFGILAGVLTIFVTEFIALFRLYRRIDGDQKRRKAEAADWYRDSWRNYVDADFRGKDQFSV